MGVPYFSEDQVRELVTLAEVIDGLEDVLRREGDGTDGAASPDATVNIDKSMATWNPVSSAHTLGGVDLGTGFVAFKNWVNTPRGATATLSLFDAVTGELLAVMEAAHLGSLRTAAIAGLATRWMAPPDASRFTVIGSGRQALRQVQAVAAVAPLKQVSVWSPTEANRTRFAHMLAPEVDVDVRIAPTMAAALDDVDILTVVTRAQEPFVTAADLGTDRPMHINAMGALLPRNAELDAGVLGLAEDVAVDNLANARRGSRELREHFGPELDGVQVLGRLIEADYSRPPAARLTVFKAMGMGLSDVAAATVIARNADIERTAS